MRKRATAVIVRDGSILLIRRVKEGREYYIFPGGGVEETESTEAAMRRETKEETSLEVLSSRQLFVIKVGTPELDKPGERFEQEEHVFLVESYSGNLDLSGPEKERSTPDNQYHLEWHLLSELDTISTLYPRELVKMLPPFLT